MRRSAPRMPGATRGEVRSYLARFLFRGDEVDKDVGTLSGGEAARLALALLFLDKPNFLVLDEVSSHNTEDSNFFDNIGRCPLWNRPEG